MKNIRVRLSRITAKKVPALLLVVVGLVGMVAGVLAAAMTITPVTFNGEVGTIHSNTGAFTVTDTGLSVVANQVSSNASTAVTIAGSGIALNNALSAGHWMDIVTFVMTTPSVGSHVASITFRTGSGPQGSTLATFTSGTWTTSGSSSGTVTTYVDLGTADISGPLTAYVNVT